MRAGSVNCRRSRFAVLAAKSNKKRNNEKLISLSACDKLHALVYGFVFFLHRMGQSCIVQYGNILEVFCL